MCPLLHFTDNENYFYLFFFFKGNGAIGGGPDENKVGENTVDVKCLKISPFRSFETVPNFSSAVSCVLSSHTQCQASI